LVLVQIQRCHGKKLCTVAPNEKYSSWTWKLIIKAR
jgi:hypothetical protein